EGARDGQLELLYKFSESSQVHSSLSTYLHNLGRAYRKANRLDEAEATLRDAVKHQATAMGRGSAPAEIRALLSGSYAALADVLRTRGKIADAVTCTCERQKLWPKQPAELALVARDLVKCAALVGKAGEKLSAADQAEQDRILDLALAALRQALEQGYRDWTELEGGPAFALLRGRPALQELLRHYKM